MCLHKMKKYILAVFVSAFVAVSCNSSAPLVSSPDGTLTVKIEAPNGNLQYSALKDGEPILTASQLGFVLKDGTTLGRGGYSVTGFKRFRHCETWETVWGQSHYVKDNHRGVLVDVEDSLGHAFSVEFRLFNDGLGFRYIFPEELGNFDIMDELTEFNFAQPHMAWWMDQSEPYYEGYGIHTGFDEITNAYTPVTIEGSDGRFYSIHEAALLDFAKMNLTPTSDRGLKAWLTPWHNGVAVHVTKTRTTPWRTLLVTDRTGALIESNLMLNLNEPCKIEDTSWIKPGKYVGIWWTMHKFLQTWCQGENHGATTANAKRHIDFAASHNIQAVLVEGWNEGWEGDWMRKSDSINFTKAYPDYDFDAVMRYANRKGVQMVIHNETAANTVNYFKQIDDAYALYERYDMHYVKTGNVNLLMDGKEPHDGQYGVNRLHAIVEKAAQYEICIDEHEPCIPTGVCRTWPNLMTGEAIRGQEHDAWEQDGGNKPEHQEVCPFLRGLAGPMDYTFGTFDFSNPNSPFSRVQTTVAKQLAEYVVIYSPLQMASDDPSAYEGVKAFDFIRDVATDWEQTKVLDAVIGDYIITARQVRNSDEWFLGAITDENSRDFSISLSFLGRGKYLAQIYADGPDASWEDNPTDVAYSELEVGADDVLDMHLATSGGCAVRLVKLKD